MGSSFLASINEQGASTQEVDQNRSRLQEPIPCKQELGTGRYASHLLSR